MKLTITLMLIGILNTYAGGYSQDIPISVNIQNGTLTDLFNAIEKNTEFKIFYKTSLINNQETINLKADHKPVSELLTTVLGSRNLSYDLVDKVIVITAAEESKQAIKITGTVKDAGNGDPIPGVNVVVEGTTVGAVTDIDGKYSIEVPNAGTVLVFSFVGYNPEKIAIQGKTVIDVNLIMEIKSLDEVVVVGYGQSSRKKLASAVTSVDPEDLNRGAISDVGQLLQGKVPGLNISASGDPNRPAAVIMRGASTLNSSMSPFYVIDGVPGADISTVSMDDIASIDVLKDAAATSIYGNRAANGVIMVTTKRGKKGQMQVSYSGYVGIEKVSNQLKMMNAGELRAFADSNSLSFSADDDKGSDTNWQSEIERKTAISNSHNLSLSGGTEHNTYSASVSYIDKQGILLGSNLSRTIARLAVEQKAFNDKVKFGLNVSNSNSVANNVPQRNAVLLQAVNHLPISPVKNADGSYFENFNHSGYFNPVAMINHGDDDTKYNNLIASFTTQVQLPFGLTYDLNVSYQNSTSLHGEFYDSYYAKYNSYNFYNNPDPPATHTLVNFGTKGSALRNTYQNTSKIIESYFTWNKKFGDHAIVATLGYSWQGNIYNDGFQASSTNFPVDNIGYNNLALSNYTSVSGYIVNFGADGLYQETRLISDFARLNYNFGDKYLLQGSVRRDGSSVFGKNNKWGYFPSVGIAWRISQEGFMQGQSIINDLKLRGSYGEAGNSSGFNAYTAQFMSGSLGTFYYNGIQTGAYGPTQAANPDLKWEKTATMNVGLDFTVLKGRISGSVEWYDKKTNDMIYQYAVDQILVPAGVITANGGSMRNKGIEVSLNLTPVQTKEVNWTTNINLAHNVNTIESLTNPLFVGGDSVRITQPDGGGQTGSTLQILKAGKPLGQFFTLQYAGKDANGVSQYVDHNGNLTTSPAIGVDYHYAGSPQPKILLGWTNTVTYKNFDFNVFIRGVFGNKIFNATRADLFRPTTAHLTNILKDAANESTTDVNSYKYSSRFIEDGSYLRLDNATLGYNFKNLGKYIQTLRLYVSGNNLLVITKYNGIDPEVNQGGIAPGVDSNNFYPKTRTILFGVNVLF